MHILSHGQKEKKDDSDVATADDYGVALFSSLYGIPERALQELEAPNIVFSITLEVKFDCHYLFGACTSYHIHSRKYTVGFKG